MNSELKDQTSENRLQKLFEQRKAILKLTPQAALDRILSFPQPAALVHSFPEEDLHMLIQDIGLDDCLPILSLASARQWQYILDVEGWRKDHPDLKGMTEWMQRFLAANPDGFIRWFLTDATQMVEWYLNQSISVRIREHDEDFSDLGDDFFTKDDVFYISIHHDDDDADFSGPLRREFVESFLDHLAAYDHESYQKVLFEAMAVIPAETEEENYRLRNVRLAEKGLLPYEEAVGVYQPLKAEAFFAQRPKYLSKTPDPEALWLAPMVHGQEISNDSLFGRALAQVSSNAICHLQAEFAGLCNQVIVADRIKISGRNELSQVVKKVSGYLGIGLERLTIETCGADVARSAAIIERFALSAVFRVGFGLALKLKWRAESWRSESWMHRSGLGLTFWDEKWLGVLGGLFLPKPQFFDGFSSGQLYREFSTLADLNQTEAVLTQVIEIDALLDKMPIEADSLARFEFLTYKNLLLTLWARHCLGLKPGLEPLPIEVFKPFFSGLWQGKTPPYQIRSVGKSSFLNWLSQYASLSESQLTDRIGGVADALFQEMETEYGHVSPEALDPRYTPLFLFKTG